MNSCISCAKLIPCPDPDKGITYVCKKFTPKTPPSQKEIASIEEVRRAERSAREADADTSKVSEEEARSSEIDLIAALDEVFDSKTKQPRNLKVDDRDLKEFANYKAFFTGTTWGLKVRPFPRQLFITSALFQEICPFCTDKKLLSILSIPVDMNLDEYLERTVFTRFGVCPKCKRPRTTFEKHFPYRQETKLLLGQRVGKSLFLVAPPILYLTHKYLKIPTPYSMFGLGPTLLVGTMVAQTYAKALEQLWIPYMAYMEQSRWFKEYNALVKDTADRTGEDIYRVTASRVHYPHKMMMVYPSGPNRGTLRGNTRFAVGIDEIEYIDTVSQSEDAVKLNASAIYDSLDRSLLTVRAAHERLYTEGRHSVLGAFGFYASSPVSVNSFLWKSVQGNDETGPTQVYNLPTWDVNPNLPQYSKTIQKAYREDFAKAERDYGAKPAMSDSPFIADRLTIFRHCGPSNNAVEYEYTRIRREHGDLEGRSAKIVAFRTDRYQSMPPAVMSMDAGYSNNSFAISIAYRSDGKKIRHSVLVEVAPRLKENVIDYNRIYTDLLVPLVKTFNVKAVIADRWNSIKLFDDLRAETGVYTEAYIAKMEDFSTFLSYVEGGAVQFPKCEMKETEIFRPEASTDYPHGFQLCPVAHLVYQSATVRSNGRQVVKGRATTDDLFRAAVLSSAFLLDDEFYERHLKGKGTQSENPSDVGLGANAHSSYSMIAIPSPVLEGEYLPRDSAAVSFNPLTMQTERHHV